MLKSSLCDYSDAYVLVSGTITIRGGQMILLKKIKKTYERNKGVIFRNCAPFTECASGINNTKINHAKDLDIVTAT